MLFIRLGHGLMLHKQINKQKFKYLKINHKNVNRLLFLSNYLPIS